MMMNTFTNIAGGSVVDKLIITIQENKQYLSDIDGLIGDGDHGINMNKGFTLCREELDLAPGGLSYSLKVLAKILMMKIGGSMGPLYGKFFKAMALSLESKEQIGIDELGYSLKAAAEAIMTITDARVGDKTLMDSLIPAVDAYEAARKKGKSFPEAIDAMKDAAREGRDSTKNMIARLGRASRLGERSRGVPDPGATSCCLILESIGDGVKDLIK